MIEFVEVRYVSENVLNVFALILVRDRDITSTWLQVDRPSFTKLFVFDRESLVQNVCDVIFQGPGQVLVVLLVDALHIVDVDFLAQHHLVECTDEERVEEATMEDGKTDHTTNEFEIVEMLWVDA
jgi:hypothetical protein